MTSTIRQIKIQDGVDSTLLAGVNSNQEVKVHDADLLTVGVASITLQTASNVTLSSIEEATEAIQAKQITNGITSVSVLCDILRELKKMNLYNSLASDIEIEDMEVE